jgi:hypothetical protein
VDKAIAISSSKSLQDRSDLSVSVSVPKKIYTKDLLQVMRADPQLRHNPLVYSLSN